MARISITIVLPEWNVADLRTEVHDLDSYTDQEGIAPEYVVALDVLTYLIDGSLSTQYEVVDSALEDD